MDSGQRVQRAHHGDCVAGDKHDDGCAAAAHHRRTECPERLKKTIADHGGQGDDDQARQDRTCFRGASIYMQ